jgi:drug/metabolite transporter (DMT)-like permease
MVALASAPVFIRGLSDAFDPYSLCFARYVSAAIGLSALNLLWFRGEFLRLLRRPGALAGVALLNTVMQVTWTIGTYGSTATVALLVSKLSAVFVIVFSYALFHEERGVIRHPKFLTGAAVSFLGVMLVLAKDPGRLLPVFDASAALLMLTSALFAAYMVWSKHIVMKTHPIPMFGAVAVYTAGLTLAVSLVLGTPETLTSAGGGAWGVAFASGLIPIALAHPTYNFAQKHLGSAFSATVHLANPLVTYLLALVALQEWLTGTQWAGAAVLTAGSLLVIRARGRAPSRELDRPEFR